MASKSFGFLLAGKVFRGDALAGYWGFDFSLNQVRVLTQFSSAELEFAVSHKPYDPRAEIHIGDKRKVVVWYAFNDSNLLICSDGYATLAPDDKMDMFDKSKTELVFVQGNPKQFLLPKSADVGIEAYTNQINTLLNLTGLDITAHVGSSYIYPNRSDDQIVLNVTDIEVDTFQVPYGVTEVQFYRGRFKSVGLPETVRLVRGIPNADILAFKPLYLGFDAVNLLSTPDKEAGLINAAKTRVLFCNDLVIDSKTHRMITPRYTMGKGVELRSDNTEFWQSSHGLKLEGTTPSVK